MIRIVLVDVTLIAGLGLIGWSLWLLGWPIIMLGAGIVLVAFALFAAAAIHSATAIPRQRKPRRKQTPAEMNRVLRQFAALHNANLKDGQKQHR